ncbi:alpha/beta fold hydrolase [Spirillospora sp. NPDC029432]|uniref:alpha/beta fold hydrolase n=1 Tax=Spirillospora sp. NPDC029432 TaxID=3154599 RepID=UPI003456E609
MTTGRMIETNGVELWTEEFGDPAHPPVLLIAGSMSQGVTWPDALVGRLAAAGRRVIRYDHRDTGRSSVIDFEREPYSWADVKDDALGVLDAYGIAAAHVVGHSAGGLVAQWIAAEHPDRVLSLAVIGSSPLGRREGQVLMRALTGEPPRPGDLPPPLPAFVEFYAEAMASPPPADRASMIDFAIETARLLNGPDLPFDEDEQRRLEERIHDRARRPGSEAGHGKAGGAYPDFEPTGLLGGITAPTLVIEGGSEPCKPGHGALIAAEIPGAELLMIDGMGHLFAPQILGEVGDALLAHTGARPVT